MPSFAFGYAPIFSVWGTLVCIHCALRVISFSKSSRQHSDEFSSGVRRLWAIVGAVIARVLLPAALAEDNRPPWIVAPIWLSPLVAPAIAMSFR